ncbi:MAG: 23S rRNA (adenine(2503)-C(2))-methyltransferase [Polyangiaceae bacterium UTPRO1]|nr:23S rRNA (adenine(2503)-C(2))-methyltransferase RlmN [Myxococcales bacterium]OQY66943.1 MAG: 23S rRNA (adenine(2503)-C(2))-methyltransferase [Polyangiaceae bacterium UTPRO1]
MNATSAPANVLDLSQGELEAWCAAHGAPAYRAAQIARWLYRHGAGDFAAMRNLPADLRAALAAELYIGLPEVAAVVRSADGTCKLGLRLADGAAVESVLIPDDQRLTLCLSTQAGCAMGCAFCATATLGLSRHLRQSEIVGQFLVARTLVAADPGAGAAALAPAAAATDGAPERISNVVFMGMGEPLHNYEGTVAAIATLTADWGLGLSPRRITVSTVGLVPEMRRLLADTRVNLAVSLTAIDQETRRRLMPVSKRYPVGDLLAACRALPLPRRQRITFEYVMLAGVNDSPRQAQALARALGGIRCKVNLIPFNPFPGAAFERSDDLAVARFQDALRNAGIHATVRESRGPDIAAACGQLVAEGAVRRPAGRRRCATADAAGDAL